MKIRQQPQSLQSLLLVVDDKNSVLREISAKGSRNIVYTAYGDRPDASTNSHLGYNGELREVKCGWYMLGNGYRAFNPRLMRFHSPDSWSPFGEGGLNAYAYCGGNPIMRTDPTGHMGKWVKMATGGWSMSVSSNVNPIPLIPDVNLAKVPGLASVETSVPLSSQVPRSRPPRDVPIGIEQATVVKQSRRPPAAVTTASSTGGGEFQPGGVVGHRPRAAKRVTFSEMAERVHFDSREKFKYTWLGVDDIAANATSQNRRSVDQLYRPKQFAERKQSFIRKGLQDGKI